MRGHDLIGYGQLCRLADEELSKQVVCRLPFFREREREKARKRKTERDRERHIERQRETEG